MTTIGMAELAIPPIASLTLLGRYAALPEWCMVTCLLIGSCLLSY